MVRAPTAMTVILLSTLLCDSLFPHYDYTNKLCGRRMHLLFSIYAFSERFMMGNPLSLGVAAIRLRYLQGKAPVDINTETVILEV